MMKFLMTLLLILAVNLSFAQGPQTWPDAFNQNDVNTIKAEITSVMDLGDIDAVLKRVEFPFRAGDKEYKRAELKAKFNELFTLEMCSELATSESYEVMNPEGDAYMLVCRYSPDGYEAAIPVFKKRNAFVSHIETCIFLVNISE